jgi:pyruvate dehydrogenase E1 component
VAFEPAWVDELAEIMRWSFEHMQAPDGSAVYLRLSTRPVPQPDRVIDEDLRRDLLAGGYWIVPPSDAAELAIVCAGPLAPEAHEAHAQILEDSPGAGLLAVTSADRLHAGWTAAQRARAQGAASAASHVERLLGALGPDAALVTVIDGHPASLSWLGGVAGHRAYPLGVDHFGQSGDIPDLYRVHRLDVDAILEAAATACIERRRRSIGRTTPRGR